MNEASSYILKQVQEALDKVDQGKVAEFVDLILSSKKIFVYGVGRSGLVGQSFAVRLVQLGMDVHFVGDMATPIVEKGDLVILISNTGETMSVVQTANIVGRIGAKIISVTSSVHSKLGSASDVVLEITQDKDEQRKRLAPLGTIFEVATSVLLDSLVPVLMLRLGQTESSLRKRHAIWV